MKVLIVSQASVQHNPGGAEVAAENLSRGLSEFGLDVHLAFAVPHQLAMGTVRLRDGAITKYAVPSVAQHPDFWNRDSKSVGQWRTLVEDLNPDIVHAHHFFGVGTNVLANMCRSKPTILTLHEYLAICHRDGQLVRRSGSLCRKPSEFDCLTCNNNSFVDGGLAFVRARTATFKKLLGLPKTLLAPSQFLKDQYAEWGIAKDRIQVIPNVLQKVGPEFRPTTLGVPKILYLSSISKIKGAEVVIEAACELFRRGVRRNSLEIEMWGTGVASYMKEIIERKTEDSGGIVKLMGRFERDDLDSVLSRASALICPSVWFENRPTVIDEAILRGIPIIVSNIGGMKELATSVAGITFRAGDAVDLADVMERFISNQPPRRTPTQDLSATVRRHIEVYERNLGLGVSNNLEMS